MKNYRNAFVLATVALFFFACNEQPESTDSQSVLVKQEAPTALKMQTLMKETLALAENVEVITSYVEVPPNTTLPMHFHPGEEFAYVLEGSGTMILEGQENKGIKVGEAGMVPFKSHHTFTSSDEGIKLIVFRVHEKGQPERVLVE